MSEHSVAICGAARDCARHLPSIMRQIEQLGALFGNYKVFVVENDSSDDTGAILDAWSGGNTLVTVTRFSRIERAEPQSEHRKAGPAWFRADRIRRICFARNIYLDALKSRNPDYVIVLDMDLLGFSMQGIATTFASAGNWEAVASNGLRYTLRAPLRPRVHWDTYAYEPDSGFEGGRQTLAGIRKAQGALERQLRSGEWLSTKSAFGGLCIYRGDLLAGAKYSAPPNDDPDIPYLCEHVGLHRAIRESHPTFRVHINPAQSISYEAFGQTVRRSIVAAIGRLGR